MQTQARAFTLVELLVVIGIIAVLISVLLPALNKANDAARSTKCLSNMKQAGMATVLYTNDNKGKWLPPYKAAESTPNWVPSGAPSWSGPFFFIHLSGRYLKEDPRPWICPTDRYVDGRPYMSRLYSKPKDANSSYMMNFDMPRYINDASNPVRDIYKAPFDHIYYFHPHPLKPVKSPTKLIVYCEAGQAVSGGYGYMASYRSATPQAPYIMRFDHRKQRAMTIGFADGHAEQLERSEILLREGETGVPNRIREYWYGHPTYATPWSENW